MLRWLENMRIRNKIALPFAIVLGVAVALVGIARSGMQQLARDTQHVIEVSASRVECSLVIVTLLNEAVNHLKEAILEDDDETITGRQAAHAETLDGVQKKIDLLLQMAETDGQRKVNDDLAALLGQYRDTAERVIQLAAQHRDDDARALDAEKAAPLRRQLIASAEAHAAENKQEMQAASQDAMAAEARVAGTLLTAAVIGLGSASLLLGFVVLRLVVRPLTRTTAAMTAIAGGDYAIAVTGQQRRDEVGALLRALQTFKDNGLEMQRLQAEQERAEAVAEAERRAVLADMADRFEAGVSGIVAAVASSAARVHDNASAMATGAEGTARQTMAVAATSEQTSANVGTVAGATEELSASIREISQLVGRAGSTAQGAVAEAQEADATMRQLVQAAAEIGEVVGLISSIAGQTNLLALNATIEAARAGEMGKGFAVVASEVKALATQTARATEEISGKVQGIAASTDRAVRSIASIGGTIAQISEISGSISAAVEEQDAATRDIATNIAQAAGGSVTVAEHIRGIERAASEAGSAAATVLGEAGSLNAEATRLAAEVAGFLRGVRAG